MENFYLKSLSFGFKMAAQLKQHSLNGIQTAQTGRNDGKKGEKMAQNDTSWGTQLCAPRVRSCEQMRAAASPKPEQLRGLGWPVRFGPRWLIWRPFFLSCCCHFWAIKEVELLVVLAIKSS